MPVEFSSEALQMVTAGAIVAALALPLGFLSWALGRARSTPMLPPWKPWRVPWGGFEVFAAYIVVAFTIPFALAQSRLLPTAVGVIALPIQLAFLAFTLRTLYPNWRSRFLAMPVLPLAVLVWAILTPLVLLFHAGVVQLFTAMGWKPDEHPLAKLGGGPLFENVLFLLQACVAAPLIEEILFRGVLLAWVIGGRERSQESPPQTPTAIRPWLVMGVAVLFAALSGKVGPVVFAGGLAAGLVIVWVTVRRGKRHLRAVYASAAMFAMVHSAVWPSPVPLFLLGLGLGWCAVRTRGVLVPAIVHGLFNAVSAVYVLRGGTS